jgi:carbon storage regulator
MEDREMLVLTRRPNETIVIDGRIQITVVEIRGGQIRLGIEAPREIPVWRKELEVRAPAAA